MLKLRCALSLFAIAVPLIAVADEEGSSVCYGDTIPDEGAAYLGVTLLDPGSQFSAYPDQITICAGSWIALAGGGGGDCDIAEASSATKCGPMGCSASGNPCASEWHNSDIQFEWEPPGSWSIQQDLSNDPLNSRVYVKAPINEPSYFSSGTIKVSREQAGKYTDTLPPGSIDGVAADTLQVNTTSPPFEYLTIGRHTATTTNFAAWSQKAEGATATVFLEDSEGTYTNFLDHPCCAGVDFSGSMGTFTGAGLNIVDSGAKLASVFAMGFEVKIVTTLGWCGGSAGSYDGCAKLGLNNIIMPSGASDRAFAHEYGHTAGLDHPSSTDPPYVFFNFMHYSQGVTQGGGQYVLTSQCDEVIDHLIKP